MRGRGDFQNGRCMDNLYLNRMITPEADKPAKGGQDSRQGIVKKEQEIIIEISTGSLRCLKISIKIRFRHALVISNRACATLRGVGSTLRPVSGTGGSESILFK
jgi:hypothetical protein